MLFGGNFALLAGFFFGIGATIRIGKEMLGFSYAGLFWLIMDHCGPYLTILDQFGTIQSVYTRLFGTVYFGPVY